MAVRKGLVLVISGPAGAGKGTLASMLLKRDGRFKFSISATTRAPRETEVPDVDYYFLNDEEFAQWDERGEFLETAVVHGHHYGTPYKPIIQAMDDGKDLLLDIDSQGAMSVIDKVANCVTVFILPPSFTILEQRLRKRNTECEADLQRRLHNARGEVEQIGRYNYVIINDEIEDTYRQLEAIVIAERHNTIRYQPEIGE